MHKITQDSSVEDEHITYAKPYTDQDLLKEVQRLTRNEFEIKPQHLYLLAPHIITRKHAVVKKDAIKRYNPASPNPMNLWIDIDEQNLLELLHGTAEDLKTITMSAGYILYVVDHNREELFLCTKSMKQINGKRFTWKINDGESTIAVYAAKEVEAVVVKNNAHTVDKRFPDGQDLGDFYASNILALPVQKDNFCCAIIELYKTNGVEYTKHDYNTGCYIANLAGNSIARNQQMTKKRKDEEINDVILTEMLRGMSEDSQVANTFSEYIINFTKTILDVESITYFSVIENDDCERKYTSDHNPVTKLDSKKKKIRIEKEKQLARHLIGSGTLMNFPDVFNDLRFDKSVDRFVGILIRSVIGIEIPKGNRQEDFGVLLAINKLSNEKFTSTDEEFFNKIAKCLRISLAYQELYNDFKWREQFNLNFIDIVRFQIQRRYKLPEFYSLDENIYLPQDFHQFTFVPDDPDHREIPKYIFYIFQSVKSYFPDKDVLYKFIFAVKKVHRDNPYHNFYRAFMSIHFIYLLFHYHREMFSSSIERVALLMAAILHAVDHRGVSGKYLDIIKHPIMNHPYPAPVEMHHYFVAKCLLDATKILQHIKPEKLATFYRIFKECILSASIKLYIKRRIDLRIWLRTGILNLNNPKHRIYVRTLLMTAENFTPSIKSVEFNKYVVRKMYEELFHEGDLLRELGHIPPLIMDRMKSESIPRHEANYISTLTLPCFDMLKQIFPKTEILYQNAQFILLHRRLIKIWNSEATPQSETDYSEQYITDHEDIRGYNELRDED